jgi:hypothetical protein
VNGEESLQRLAAIGQLRRITADPAFVLRLLGNSRRLLKDAQQEAVSIETRCIAAYSAAHLLSLAALHARGFEPIPSRGHRTLVFQTLAPAIGAQHTLLVPLAEFHKKRNEVEYRGANAFRLEDVTHLIRLCGMVWSLCRSWLQANRPDFLLQLVTSSQHLPA